MGEIIYIGCAIISIACAALLFKSYRQSQAKVLLWVALCFAFLAVNNVFVCIDLIVFPELNMEGSIVRNAFLACAGSTLAAGLLWELS